MHPYVVSIIGASNQHKAIAYEDILQIYRYYANELNALAGKPILLQSGGSTGIDFIAILLFLSCPERFQGLVLHLPCEYDIEEGRFFAAHPGQEKGAQTLNQLYPLFEAETGYEARKLLSQVLRMKGVSRTVSSGLIARNKLVAQCDLLLAASHTNKVPPPTGGTRDTWKQCMGERKYFLIGPSS